MAARDLGPRELAALGERAEALVEAAARILLGRERRDVLRALGKAKTVDEMDAILADVLTRYRSRQGIFYRRWLARLLTVDTRAEYWFTDYLSSSINYRVLRQDAEGPNIVAMDDSQAFFLGDYIRQSVFVGLRFRY